LAGWRDRRLVDDGSGRGGRRLLNRFGDDGLGDDGLGRRRNRGVRFDGLLDNLLFDGLWGCCVCDRHLDDGVGGRCLDDGFSDRFIGGDSFDDRGLERGLDRRDDHLRGLGCVDNGLRRFGRSSLCGGSLRRRSLLGRGLLRRSLLDGLGLLGLFVTLESVTLGATGHHVGVCLGERR
jgi:hypothetical protein